MDNIFGRLAKTTIRVMRRAGRDDVVIEPEHGAKGLKEKKIHDHYDEPEDDFALHFRNVLLPVHSFPEYMDKNYAKRLGELVGIELGGPARQLFVNGFPEGIFKYTAGFTIADLRSEEEKKSDTRSHHAVIPADVFFIDGAGDLSWQTVEEWVEKHGRPDLVIERMVQPLHLIHSPAVFLRCVWRWFSILNEGGTMFLELPKKFPVETYPEIETLLKKLQTSSKHTEVVYSMSDPDHRNVRIRKLPGCPESLGEVLRGIA